MLILKKTSLSVAPVLSKRQLLCSNIPLLYFNIYNLRGENYDTVQNSISGCLWYFRNEDRQCHKKRWMIFGIGDKSQKWDHYGVSKPYFFLKDTAHTALKIQRSFELQTSTSHEEKETCSILKLPSTINILNLKWVKNLTRNKLPSTINISTLKQVHKWTRNKSPDIQIKQNRFIRFRF